MASKLFGIKTLKIKISKSSFYAILILLPGSLNVVCPLYRCGNRTVTVWKSSGTLQTLYNLTILFSKRKPELEFPLIITWKDLSIKAAAADTKCWKKNCDILCSQNSGSPNGVEWERRRMRILKNGFLAFLYQKVLMSWTWSICIVEIWFKTHLKTEVFSFHMHFESDFYDTYWSCSWHQTFWYKNTKNQIFNILILRHSYPTPFGLLEEHLCCFTETSNFLDEAPIQIFTKLAKIMIFEKFEW